MALSQETRFALEAALANHGAYNEIKAILEGGIDAITTDGITMSGTTAGIKMTGAVSQVFDFTDATTAVLEDDKAFGSKAGSIKILMPSGAAAYINVYDGAAS